MLIALKRIFFGNKNTFDLDTIVLNGMCFQQRGNQVSCLKDIPFFKRLNLFMRLKSLFFLCYKTPINRAI